MKRKQRKVSERVLQLLDCGHDFDFLDFSLGPPEGIPREYLLDVWKSCRAQVVAHRAAKGESGPTWAEWCFDLGRPEQKFFEREFIRG